MVPFPYAEEEKIKEQFDALEDSRKEPFSLKLKLFINNDDLSRKFAIFCPNSMQMMGKRQLSALKSIADSKNLREDNESIKNSVVIFKK